MGGSQNSRCPKWGGITKFTLNEDHKIDFSQSLIKKIAASPLFLLYLDYFTILIHVFSDLIYGMVDALKSSEFSRLHRLAVSNVLCKLERTRGNGRGGGYHEIQTPLNRGDRRFPYRYDRGITEYRGRILPHMSITPSHS